MEKQYQAELMLHTYMDNEGQPENWQFRFAAAGPEDAGHNTADMEETARQYLQTMQGCVLAQTPPFDTVPASPQTIAEHFWEPLYQVLAKQGYALVSLEVERSDGAVYTRRSKSVTCRRTELVPQQAPTLHIKAPRRGYVCAGWLMSLLLFALCTAGLALWVWYGGNGQPLGQHIWEHLYGGDFTGYHPSFFSLFASQAPLPYGIYTLVMHITGSVQYSYFAMLALLYGVGAVGWMIWSKGKERILLCAVLAAAWFVSPPMLYVVFVQGYLPLAFCLAGVPYLLYFVYEYLEYRKLNMFYGTAFCVFCMVLSHAAAVAVALVALAVFLLLYGLMNKEWKKTLTVTVAAGIGILFSCFWLVPAVRYGLVGVTEELPLESILDAIYPIYMGSGSMLYIGVAVFGVAVLGALCSNWRRAAGFWTAAICAVVLVCLHKSLLLMIGMAVLLGLVSAALLRWRPCPKWVLLACAALLLADGIFAYHGTHPWTDTRQKVALPQELQQQWVSALGNVVPEEGNYVIQNRRMGALRRQHMEEAFEAGHYYYVFDRSLESGAGVVMADRKKVAPERTDKLMDAATKSGYRYQDGVQEAYVFYRETPAQFGTTAAYRGIGIGTSAYYASWLFPDIQEGESPYPEDYSVEELSRYQTVYLSGWKVRDGQALETLLKQLADRNVTIVAEAGTGTRLFGVQTEELTVAGNMPALSGKVNLPELPLEMLARGITLKNPEETWIWGEKNGRREAVAGMRGPVRLIGLQLPSYTAREARVEYLPALETLLELEAGNHPQRKVVETAYQKSNGIMTVHAPQNGVILPFAYVGPISVRAGQKTKVHGLLQMQTDILVLQASYSLWGNVLTFAGILLAICYMVFVRKKRMSPRETKYAKLEL